MTKTCIQCNKEFSKPYKFSRTQFENRKYCGFECWGEHQSQAMKGRNSPMLGRNHTVEAKEKNRLAHLKPNGISKIPGYKTYHSGLRHARKLNALGTFTIREWEEKKKEFDYCCAICGTDEAKLTKDHIIPLTKGGSNFISNIQPLCQSCNSRKGNRLALA